MNWEFWRICIVIAAAMLIPSLTIFHSSPIGEPVAQDARGNGYNMEKDITGELKSCD